MILVEDQVHVCTYPLQSSDSTWTPGGPLLRLMVSLSGGGLGTWDVLNLKAWGESDGPGRRSV